MAVVNVTLLGLVAVALWVLLASRLLLEVRLDEGASSKVHRIKNQQMALCDAGACRTRNHTRHGEGIADE